MASGILLVLAVMPGFPAAPFLLLSGTTGGVARLAMSRQTRRREEAAKASIEPAGGALFELAAGYDLPIRLVTNGPVAPDGIRPIGPRLLAGLGNVRTLVSAGGSS